MNKIILGSSLFKSCGNDKKDYDAWHQYVIKHASDYYDIERTDWESDLDDQVSCKCTGFCDCLERAESYLLNLWNWFCDDYGIDDSDELDLKCACNHCVV